MLIATRTDNSGGHPNSKDRAVAMVPPNTTSCSSSAADWTAWDLRVADYLAVTGLQACCRRRSRGNRREWPTRSKPEPNRLNLTCLRKRAPEQLPGCSEFRLGDFSRAELHSLPVGSVCFSERRTF